VNAPNGNANFNQSADERGGEYVSELHDTSTTNLPTLAA